MPPVQTSYDSRIPVAFEGQIANMVPHDIDTRIVETAGGIGFGKAVGQGDADKGAVLGGAAAADFVGVSVKDITLVGAEVDEYPENSNIAVMTKGDIWVKVGGNVAAGENVTFNSTTGVLSSAATSGTQFLIAGARWMTSAQNNGFARLRLSGELPSA